MARFGCPIEMEPKTLNVENLSTAREAAVEIIQTKEIKEASSIFTQGKKAIEAAEQMKRETEKRDQLQKIAEPEEREGHGVCNCEIKLPCTLVDDDDGFLESR
ncbi:hypothetical protein Cni_G16967 [Canna indica]|uniref:Uncharacterized protein n=1 Tax=Canna indica TaxID=4628 RepID=A0AAQ3KG54_9LILI|nr:hypothetical protein Cni_G16967 [Canna indica]